MRKRQTKVSMALLALVLLMVFITACKAGADKDVQEPKQNAQQVQPAEEEQQEALQPGAVSEIRQAENEKTPEEQAA